MSKDYELARSLLQQKKIPLNRLLGQTRLSIDDFMACFPYEALRRGTREVMRNGASTQNMEKYLTETYERVFQEHYLPGISIEEHFDLTIANKVKLQKGDRR